MNFQNRRFNPIDLTNKKCDKSYFITLHYYLFFRVLFIQLTYHLIGNIKSLLREKHVTT